MLSNELSKMLSEQVNAEYYSAYLYLAMSAKAEEFGFKGIANWLYVQAKEEVAHGTHILQFIFDRGGVPEFDAIAKPETDFKNFVAMFEKVLAHEQYVTERINKIATAAMKVNDHATYNFILWYVNEQIEEEDTANDLLNKVRSIGDNSALLYNLDTELATRTFVDPFANA